MDFIIFIFIMRREFFKSGKNQTRQIGVTKAQVMQQSRNQIIRGFTQGQPEERLAQGKQVQGS